MGTIQQACMLVYNGFIYGTSQDGGANGKGYIWRMDLSNPPDSVVIHTFVNTNRVGLVEYNGLIYGCVDEGGANNLGFIYSINPTTLAFTQLASLSTSTGYRMNQFPLSPTINSVSTRMHAVNGFIFACTRLGNTGNGDLFRYQISTDTITPLTPPFGVAHSGLQNFSTLGTRTFEYTIGSLLEVGQVSTTVTTLTTDAGPNQNEVPSNTIIYNNSVIYGVRTSTNTFTLYDFDPVSLIKSTITAASGIGADFFYRGLTIFNSNLYVFSSTKVYVLNASYVLQSTTIMPSTAICPGEQDGLGNYYIRLVSGITSDLYRFDLTLLTFTLVPQNFIP